MDRDRRRLLQLVGTAGIIGATGCVGDEVSDVVDDEEDDTESTGEDDVPEDDDFSEDVNDQETNDGKSNDEDEEVPELPENGVVAFVYHDGPIHDYTEAFPAHEAYDAPATTCVVTDWIGTSRGVADRLDVEHLEELHDAGWEIGSHTTDHATLGEFELLTEVGEDDHRIYPEEHRHGHHPGKEVEITDGSTSVLRTIEGFGDDEDEERYVELTEAVGESFPAGDTVVRYPEDEIHNMLADSKEALETLGFEAYSFLAPYDNFGEYAMEFVPDYYECVANASLERPRINYLDIFDPYELRHRYFIEFTTPEDVKRDLDEIATTGALGVFGAHAFKEEVTEDAIRETLQWIEDRDIEVMTLRDAVELYDPHAAHVNE